MERRTATAGKRRACSRADNWKGTDMFRKVLAGMLISVVAIAMFGCEVRQTREGRLPEVEVEGGQLPEFEVETADVEVRRRTVDVTVPDVDIEIDRREVELTVPDIDVTMPSERRLEEQ
jgi:hypothetical protein